MPNPNPEAAAAPGPLPATAPELPPTPAPSPTTEPTEPTPEALDPEPGQPLPAGVREALSTLRADRRQLKAEVESLQRALAALQQQPNPAGAVPAVQTPGPAAPTAPAAPAPTPAAQPPVDPLAQAQEAVAQADQNIAAVRALLKRVKSGDVEGALASLQASNIQPPVSGGPELEDWLEGLSDVYRDQRTEAQVEARLLRTRTAERDQSMRRQADAWAVQAMPELADANSPRARRAQLLMEAHPWLKDDPRGRAILVNAIRGMELQEASPTPASTPAATRPVVIPAPRGQTALPGAPAAIPAASRPAGANELFRKYQATGSEQDKAAWQAALARDMSAPAAARS